MIQRIIDPEKVIHLVPWLVPVDQTVAEIGAEIYRLMLESPEEILVLVDLDDKGVCHGLAVATLRDDCVFIWQTRTDFKCRNQKAAMMILKEWGQINGKTQIQSVPSSNSIRRLHRRYGILSV